MKKKIRLLICYELPLDAGQTVLRDRAYREVPALTETALEAVLQKIETEVRAGKESARIAGPLILLSVTPLSK